MSTQGIQKRSHGKHVKINQKTQPETKHPSRLAGASLALMLSVSTAVFTQSVTMAFASESDQDPASESTEATHEAIEISDDMIPLAGSSVSACARALTSDLGMGASLVDAASYDAEAERAAARAAQVDAVVDMAIQQLGAPYRYGGTTPAGFDCSGFTGYVFCNALGMELPRSAAAQSGLAESISLDEAERGDLIFWGGRGGVYHTGIYLGDGEYIHAAASGCVQIQNVGTYAPSFAMRLI